MPKPEWAQRIEKNRADPSHALRREVMRALGAAESIEDMSRICGALVDALQDATTRWMQLVETHKPAPPPAPEPRPPRVAPGDRPESTWLDSKQAAAVLNVAVSKLESWRSKGGGPPVHRIGSRIVRYNLAELNAWMSEQR